MTETETVHKQTQFHNKLNGLKSHDERLGYHFWPLVSARVLTGLRKNPKVRP